MVELVAEKPKGNTLKQTLPSLSWPKREVQVEWGLLGRCLTDPAFRRVQNSDEKKKLLELAGLHGVGPLLFYRLKKNGGFDGLAERVLNELRQMYLRAAASNLILARQLLPLIETFGRARVPVLLIKGAILASTVYPDPALRPMGDIDLIVRLEHGDRAVEILEELGYVPVEAEAFGSFTRTATHALAYHRPGQSGFAVELHHILASEVRSVPQADEEWFWAHTVSIPVCGCPVLTLNAEASLLHLCVHLVSHHGWDPRFIWIYDIHAVLEKFGENFDWDKFTHLAQELSWAHYCGHALGAARRFLHTPVPEAIGSELSQAEGKSWVLDWQATWPSTRTVRTVADWRRMPDLLARLRFLWHTFFPSREYMVNRYRPSNRRVWPLLYPYRWGIMLQDAAKTIGKVGWRCIIW